MALLTGRPTDPPAKHQKQYRTLPHNPRALFQIRPSRNSR
jgi:hypothetical protein